MLSVGNCISTNSRAYGEYSLTLFTIEVGRRTLLSEGNKVEYIYPRDEKIVVALRPI